MPDNTATAERQHTGEMAVMDKSGDTKIIWNSDNVDEVDHARDTFNSFKKKNYVAYSVGEGGKKDTVIHKFDPDVEKMILVPPVVGG
jgi:agmatine/peptidylarginine deiminase